MFVSNRRILEQQETIREQQEEIDDKDTEIDCLKLQIEDLEKENNSTLEDKTKSYELIDKIKTVLESNSYNNKEMQNNKIRELIHDWQVEE